MKAFKKFTGLVAPLDKANVDTDQIIPKQFLKAVLRSGLKEGLFYDWRNGSEASSFVLNQPRFQKASILLARQNFGSGSSREHAVWALDDWGFRTVIAPSFADIFKNNCLKNGLLTVVLSNDEVERISQAVKQHDGYSLTIDLEQQSVSDDYGWSTRFEIDPYAKKCLLEGLDDIAITLSLEDKIREYEKHHPLTR